MMPLTHHLERVKQLLLRRAPRYYYDYLTPTHSHLLSISLAEQLPDQICPYPTSPPWVLPRIQQAGGPQALPDGHHLVYFPPTHPTTELLADGTDTDYWPGAPFLSRLWAGGSLSFSRDQDRLLRLDGRRVLCVETVADVRPSYNKPPPSAAAAAASFNDGEASSRPVEDRLFVDIIRSYGRVADEAEAEAASVKAVVDSPAIVERRTLAFLTRDAKAKMNAKEKMMEKHRAYERDRQSLIRKRPSTSLELVYRLPTFSMPITPTHPLLFRFSALSFNAHALHLDTLYCKSVESYKGPLVHGPLILLLMLYALKGAIKCQDLALTSIKYQIVRPLHAQERMMVCARRRKTKWMTWIEGQGGVVCAMGSAHLA